MIDVGCEGESTPWRTHLHPGRIKLPKWPRTLLSIDEVTCEGTVSSKEGIGHDSSHVVVDSRVKVDRSAGTNVSCVPVVVLGLANNLTGWA